MSSPSLSPSASSSGSSGRGAGPLRKITALLEPDQGELARYRRTFDQYAQVEVDGSKSVTSSLCPQPFLCSSRRGKEGRRKHARLRLRVQPKGMLDGRRATRGGVMRLSLGSKLEAAADEFGSVGAGVMRRPIKAAAAPSQLPRPWTSPLAGSRPRVLVSSLHFPSSVSRLEHATGVPFPLGRATSSLPSTPAPPASYPIDLALHSSYL